jgi:hypothetical protein
LPSCPLVTSSAAQAINAARSRQSRLQRSGLQKTKAP